MVCTFALAALGNVADTASFRAREAANCVLTSGSRSAHVRSAALVDI